jgi:hypothetical protein
MATTERYVQTQVCRDRRPPMLRSCGVNGCGTLTLGGACVVHDVGERPPLTRGRPHVPVPARDESTPVAFAD